MGTHEGVTEIVYTQYPRFKRITYLCPQVYKNITHTVSSICLCKDTNSKAIKLVNTPPYYSIISSMVKSTPSMELCQP